MRSVGGLIIVALAILPSTVWGATVRLTPERVTERVLEHHLGIQAAEEDVGIATADLQSAHGRFDLQLGANLSHQIDKSARSAPAIFGSRTDTTSMSLELSKRWSIGTETSLALTGARTKTTGSTFINPLLHETTITLGARQPLLHNFAGRSDRTMLQRYRSALRSADHRLQRTVQESVHQALSSYWAWVLARQRQQIADTAVRAARAFADIIAQRLPLGTALELDQYAAEANVLSRQARVLDTETEVALYAEQLRLATRLSPTTRLEAGREDVRITAPSSHAGAIAQAMGSRPDYLAMREQVKQLDLQLQMDRDGRWPELDLVSSLALNQLATTNLGTAMRGTNHPHWLVGLEFQVPLPNRGARGATRRADHTKTQSLIQLKALEDQIAQHISTRITQLQLFAQEVDLRERAEAMRAKKVELELTQYHHGRSSSELVIRAQDDYVASQLETVASRQRWQQTWLDYRLAIASLP